MDLLTVIATCGFSRNYPLVLGMIMAYSQGEPHTVHAAGEFADAQLDNEAVDEPEAAGTKEAAIAQMKRIERPLVGLLPVPAAWAMTYQATPEDLLDPCINLSVGTAQLSEYERRCAKRGARGDAAQSCAVHEYAQAAGIPLFEELALEELQQPTRPASSSARIVVESEEMLGADPFVDGTAARSRSAAGIFIEVEVETAPAPKPRARPASKSDSSRAPRREATTQHRRDETHAE
jgi:hypothetical protein